MRIERVDDKTVKCFLSNEELDEYDIDYKDFVLRSEKATELLHEIVQQAAEQVGYKPPNLMFEMQIMVMPEQGMVLTLKDGNAHKNKLQEFMDFMGGLRAMFAHMEGLAEQTQGALPDELQELVDQELSEMTETQRQQAPQEAQKPPVERPKQAIFAFQSLHDLMTYAAGLPSNLRVVSSLYEMNDIYFLYLARGSASYERYSKACVQALEFSQLCGADESQLRALVEHGSCLIAEKALRKLLG